MTVSSRNYLSGLALAIAVCIGLPVAAHAGSPWQFVVEIAQAQGSQIRLKVADIQVIGAYASPRQDPHVDHLFSTPPQGAAQRWAESKMVAAGSENRATVIVREASVIETKLKPSGSWFSRDPAERYDAALVIDVEIRDNFDALMGTASVKVTRSQTVLEDTDDEERQSMWSAMVEAMIADLDREIENQLRKHLAAYVN